MIRNRMHYAVAAALVASLALAGCKKKEETVAMTPPPMASEPAMMPPPATMPAASSAPVNVVSVDLGNAVGGDNKVTTPMSMFATSDTLYVSVTTDGMASNTPLTAKWTYQDGQVVGTETKNLSTNGPVTTEFHASKPGGWPTGRYKVEVMVNGMSSQSRDFEIK